jgi:uncharacterized membrane protein YkvA (DUF1232 family)
VRIVNTLGNGYRAGWVPTRGYESSFSPLQLLRPGEVEDIVGAVHRGELPADFQAKLGRLRLGDLQQTAIEQNCQLFFQLLVACSNGEFHRLTTAQVEAIAKVLAYVRKDDDVIPDYLPRGYTDDYQEVRAAAAELTPLLQSFKAWRLRNQVPSLWLERNSAQKPA